MAADLIAHFSSLEDPRVERNKSHALIDIVVLAVCAVASGADGWESIEQFGEEKLTWLRQYIALDNGVPSHDCISYVLSRVSPSQFRACLMSWTDALTEARGGEVMPLMVRQRKVRAIVSTTAVRFTWSAPGRVTIDWCWDNRPRMRNPTRLPRFRHC